VQGYSLVPSYLSTSMRFDNVSQEVSAVLITFSILRVLQQQLRTRTN